MSTPQFLALAADKKRRLRQLRIDRITRPITDTLGKMLIVYCWGVIALATLLAIGPVAIVAMIGTGVSMVRGRA